MILQLIKQEPFPEILLPLISQEKTTSLRKEITVSLLFVTETKAYFRCECQTGTNETTLSNHIYSNIILEPSS